MPRGQKKHTTARSLLKTSRRGSHRSDAHRRERSRVREALGELKRGADPDSLDLFAAEGIKRPAVDHLGYDRKSQGDFLGQLFGQLRAGVGKPYETVLRGIMKGCNLNGSVHREHLISHLDGMVVQAVYSESGDLEYKSAYYRFSKDPSKEKPDRGPYRAYYIHPDGILHAVGDRYVPPSGKKEKYLPSDSSPDTKGFYRDEKGHWHALYLKGRRDADNFPPCQGTHHRYSWRVVWGDPKRFQSPQDGLACILSKEPGKVAPWAVYEYEFGPEFPRTHYAWDRVPLNQSAEISLGLNLID